LLVARLILAGCAMFKLPAYDPLVIAWLGFGILAVTALAFVA